MKIFCLKCKTKKEIDKPQEVISSKGRLYKAKCPDCGSKIVRFGGRMPGTRQKKTKKDINKKSNIIIASEDEISTHQNTTSSSYISISGSFRILLVNILLWCADMFGRHKRREKDTIDRIKELEATILAKDSELGELQQSFSMFSSSMARQLSQFEGILNDKSHDEFSLSVIEHLEAKLSSQTDRFKEVYQVLQGIAGYNSKQFSAIRAAVDAIATENRSVTPTRPYDEVDVEAPSSFLLPIAKPFHDLEPHEFLKVKPDIFTTMPPIEKVKRFFLFQWGKAYTELLEPYSTTQIGRLIGEPHTTVNSVIKDLQLVFMEHLVNYRQGNKQLWFLKNTWQPPEIEQKNIEERPDLGGVLERVKNDKEKKYPLNG